MTVRKLAQGVDNLSFFIYNTFVVYTHIHMTTQLTDLEYAEWVTDQYLHHAVQSIDARLGEGYAIKNPSLVSTMVSLTAAEHHKLCQTLSD